MEFPTDGVIQSRIGIAETRSGASGVTCRGLCWRVERSRRGEERCDEGRVEGGTVGVVGFAEGVMNDESFCARELLKPGE